MGADLQEHPTAANLAANGVGGHPELPGRLGSFESVPNVLNHGAAGVVGPSHRHDIKAGRGVEQVMTLHINEGKSRQLPLLGEIDGFCGMTTAMVHAGLDLDEHYGLAVNRNQVDLASLNLNALLNDFQPSPLEVAFRGSLATCSEWQMAVILAEGSPSPPADISPLNNERCGSPRTLLWMPRFGGHRSRALGQSGPDGSSPAVMARIRSA